jgi:hypothetical protein
MNALLWAPIHPCVGGVSCVPFPEGAGEIRGAVPEPAGKALSRHQSKLRKE